MFHDYFTTRKNSTATWNPSDSLESYKPVNVDGSLNYTIDDFSYTFNSDGFRCDGFSDLSDFPVAFMGCSYTEGIGLPLHEVWVNYIIDRIIKKHSGAKIPVWNLGIGGTGIDFAARAFVKYAPVLKPKYIFYLLSSATRREFAYGDERIQLWFPKATSPFQPSMAFNLMGRLFADEHYALYRTYISLLLMQQTAKLSNTKIFVFDMAYDLIDDTKKAQIFTYLENIEYFKLTQYPFFHRNLLEGIPLAKEMHYLRERPILARDNIHPGAIWQCNIADQIWDLVKDKIISA